jgi:uncharacterized glyoxalase superfamily protein PhnB
MDTATTTDRPEGMPETQPPVLGGVAPYLMLNGAAEAAEFYKRAFGATEVARMPPDSQGRSMHIHLVVNGGSLMLSDFFPEHGHAPVAAQGFLLHQQVDDADAAWQRAVDAGATPVTPVQLMFWGDRYGQVKDPYGVTWSFGSRPK